MKFLKMSLANMQGKMSRLEMKSIIAGGSGAVSNCNNLCGGNYGTCGGGECPTCSPIPNWSGSKVCIH